MNIKLDRLKVQSFVTSDEKERLKGGAAASANCAKTQGETCWTWAPYMCYPE